MKNTLIKSLENSTVHADVSVVFLYNHMASIRQKQETLLNSADGHAYKTHTLRTVAVI